MLCRLLLMEVFLMAEHVIMPGERSSTVAFKLIFLLDVISVHSGHMSSPIFRIKKGLVAGQVKTAICL